MRHEAHRARTTAWRRRGAAGFSGIAAAAALLAGCTTTDDVPENNGAGAESQVERAEGPAQTEDGAAGGLSDDDGDARAGTAEGDADDDAGDSADDNTGAGSDDEYADMTEIERWWVDLQRHYEDREDVLTISSTPSGRQTTHEFEEPVTVQSLELYCYGDTDLTIEVMLGEAGEAGSVEEDITCAEGLHEVDLGQAESAAVDVIEVRSAPAIDVDHRHYVAVLGSAN